MGSDEGRDLVVVVNIPPGLDHAHSSAFETPASSITARVSDTVNVGTSVRSAPVHRRRESHHGCARNLALGSCAQASTITLTPVLLVDNEPTVGLL